MHDKELEQALKCDAAVPPEAKGIVGMVVPVAGPPAINYPPAVPLASIKHPERAARGTLFERLDILEDEVALLKKLLGV
jgi:hypothetical protein